MNNIFKVLLNKFKNKQPKKTNETIKKTQIGFIGKTKTVEIIDNQDVVDLVTASYGQITNETDDKLNKLKAYSDTEDTKAKRELNQTIADNKQELDAVDADLSQKIQQNTTQINAVNQTANQANNTANTANQNATNALNTANRADRKADNATNVANLADGKINNHLINQTGICIYYRDGFQRNRNWFSSFKLMTTTNVHIHASLQSLDVEIPGGALDRFYKLITNHINNPSQTYTISITIASINLKCGNKYTSANGGTDHRLTTTVSANNNQNFTFRIQKIMWMYDQNWGQFNDPTEITVDLIIGWN